MINQRLWIIEAPGKKGAFMSSLKEAGFTEDGVLATYGRLFDLPDNEMGFDPVIIEKPEKATQISWLPIRPDQIRKLALLISKADELVIATDSDLEGELIASQVMHLVKMADGKRSVPIQVSRAHIRSITGEGIINGYKNRSVIDNNRVRAAKARRILDRILGYQLHDPSDSWKLSIGRIISPLVNSFMQRPAESSVIRKQLSEGWSAVFRVKSDQAREKDSLISLLASLPDTVVETVTTEVYEEDKKPLTGGEALKLCMRSLPHSPVEIQDSIQHNYEAGKLSYPRTDSRRLGEVALKWIERTAQQQGIPFDQKVAEEKQSETLDGSHDAHEAVLPTVKNRLNLDIDLSSLSSDEAVLSVIARHSMSIGDKSKVYQKETGRQKDEDGSSRLWRQRLGKWIDSMELVRVSDDKGAYVDPLEQEIPRAADVKQGALDIWNHSVEQMVVERLMEIGLGRPSTLMITAKKAKKQYLDQFGMANGRARIMTEKVMQRLPDLLREDLAKPLQEAVTSTIENKTIAHRLSNAWTILGSPVSWKDSDSFGNNVKDHSSGKDHNIDNTYGNY